MFIVYNNRLQKEPLMSNKFTFSILCIFLFTVACQKKDASLLTEDKQPIHKDKIDTINYDLKYSTGACFGKCPIYDFYLKGNEAKIFMKKFCSQDGVFSQQLDSKTITQLQSYIKELDNQDIPSHFPSYISDLPSYKLTINNNRNYIVTSWKQAPKKYPQLESIKKLISEVYKNKNWEKINFEGVKKNDLAHQIIVKTNQGINIYDWVIGYSNYEMNPIKPLTKDASVWLIQYNPLVINPKKIKSILNNDPDIKSAEFNSIASFDR